jgi:hypothetical protein
VNQWQLLRPYLHLKPAVVVASGSFAVVVSIRSGGIDFERCLEY